jgi:hypothetical protein
MFTSYNMDLNCSFNHVAVDASSHPTSDEVTHPQLLDIQLLWCQGNMYLIIFYPIVIAIIRKKILQSHAQTQHIINILMPPKPVDTCMSSKRKVK